MALSIFKKSKKQAEDVSEKTLPVHIAIIPDGNRRWARAKGLPATAGHRQGAEQFKKIVKYCGDIGIRYITFYAFSTENWKRDESEVSALMGMLLKFLRNSEEELGKDKSKISIRVIGDRTPLSDELRQEIERVEKETAENTQLVCNIAINYGGRDELVNAAKKLANEAKSGSLLPEDIDEKVFENALYTAGCPDPDLLIRTSGEMRTSNFLPWQLAYTEFYFADINWPDFTEKEIDKAIEAYSQRQRRFGGK